MISMSIEGGSELSALLATLEETAAASVSRAAVSAAIKVMRNEAVKASPGRVKLEHGTAILRRGQQVVGITGLGIGGYRAKVKRPHGKYLELGTPYIDARHFLANAYRSAMPKAQAAMFRAAKRRIERIIERKAGQ